MKVPGAMPGPDALWVLLRIIFLFGAGFCTAELFVLDRPLYGTVSFVSLIFFGLCVFELGYRAGYKKFSNSLQEVGKRNRADILFYGDEEHQRHH